MDIFEYQVAAFRTADKTKGASERLTISALGLASEAGEVAGLVQKALERNDDISLSTLFEELGDCLWRVADICSAFNVDMGSIAANNIAKLQRRYPEGFTPQDSIARRDKVNGKFG